MRFLLKRDKTAKLMVDHPDTGELVPWSSLGRVEKKWAIRVYYREYLEEAYNSILHALNNPDTNREEEEVAEIAQSIAADFLKYISNLGDNTNKTDRGNYREIRDSSCISNRTVNKKANTVS